MTKLLANFVRDDSGAAAAEYVLILAIVGGGVAAGAYLLGTNISQALTAKANLVSTCSNNPSSSNCQ
jgi:pilus assembly protein Flp/PilA